MPDSIQKNIETTLEKLFKCICNEAQRNKEFAEKIHSVFINNSNKTVSTCESAKAENKKDEPEKSTNQFNPIQILSEKGADKLKNELDIKSNTELKDIVRFEGIEKGKKLASLERNAMINKIIDHSHKLLNQGQVFMKKDEDL